MRKEIFTIILTCSWSAAVGNSGVCRALTN